MHEEAGCDFLIVLRLRIFCVLPIHGAARVPAATCLSRPCPASQSWVIPVRSGHLSPAVSRATECLLQLYPFLSSLIYQDILHHQCTSQLLESVVL